MGNVKVVSAAAVDGLLALWTPESTGGTLLYVLRTASVVTSAAAPPPCWTHSHPSSAAHAARFRIQLHAVSRIANLASPRAERRTQHTRGPSDPEGGPR